MHITAPRVLGLLMFLALIGYAFFVGPMINSTASTRVPASSPVPAAKTAAKATPKTAAKVAAPKAASTTTPKAAAPTATPKVATQQPAAPRTTLRISLSRAE